MPWSEAYRTYESKVKPTNNIFTLSGENIFIDICKKAYYNMGKEISDVQLMMEIRKEFGSTYAFTQMDAKRT